MSLIGQALISGKKRRASVAKTNLPACYWYLLILSVAYFFILFFGLFIYYPHGIDLGPAVNLRVFTAFALLFSVVSLGFTHWSELRSQQIQANVGEPPAQNSRVGLAQGVSYLGKQAASL
jgi:hypothetical protein